MGREKAELVVLGRPPSEGRREAFTGEHGRAKAQRPQGI